MTIPFLSWRREILSAYLGEDRTVTETPDGNTKLADAPTQDQRSRIAPSRHVSLIPMTLQICYNHAVLLSSWR